MGEQLGKWDGTLRVYDPGDLYLVADRAVLLALARACFEAANKGMGSTTGYVDGDGQDRGIVVVRIDGLDSVRNPWLPAEPVREHAIPPRQERPQLQPQRAPVLAEVPSAFR